MPASGGDRPVGQQDGSGSDLGGERERPLDARTVMAEDHAEQEIVRR